MITVREMLKALERFDPDSYVMGVDADDSDRDALIPTEISKGVNNDKEVCIVTFTDRDEMDEAADEAMDETLGVGQ